MTIERKNRARTAKLFKIHPKKKQTFLLHLINSLAAGNALIPDEESFHRTTQVDFIRKTLPYALLDQNDEPISNVGVLRERIIDAGIFNQEEYSTLNLYLAPANEKNS